MRYFQDNIDNSKVLQNYVFKLTSRKYRQWSKQLSWELNKRLYNKLFNKLFDKL